MDQPVTMGLLISIAGALILGLASIVWQAGGRMLKVIDQNTCAINGLNQTVAEIKILFGGQKDRIDGISAEITLLADRSHDLANHMSGVSMMTELIARKLNMPSYFNQGEKNN